MLEVLFAFDPAVLTTFVAAGLLLNITPGVDFIFVSASAISGGPRVGMAAGLGISLGVLCHIIAASAGLSALLLTYPAAFDSIRFLGAAFLVFLAWKAWTSPTEIAKGRGAVRPAEAVRRGFVTNILNPKVALFVLAFIPQFTDPAIGPLWQQFLLLGIIFLIPGAAFSICLGAAAGFFSNALQARVRFLNKITAILFGGLAARLLID